MPEIKDLEVQFISLVRRPANGKEIVLKAAGPCRELRIIKSDDERQMVYGIVYAPDDPDAHEDWASADTIRKAAYSFMRAGSAPNVDKEHSFSPLPGAYVAESWLIRKNDPLFPDEAEGAWAVGIRVESPEDWAAVKSGEVAGLSLAGIGRMADPGPPPQSWLSKALSKLKKDTHPTMTEDDIKAIAKAAAEAAVAAQAAQVPATPAAGTDGAAPATAPAPAPAPAPAAPTEATATADLKKQVDALTGDVRELTKALALSVAKGAGSGGIAAPPSNAGAGVA
ncbi:XkdF-like putative serine protease domain-containing protein [Insolitispirillum peregrinum]|uniref:Putative phage serine protease XkdF n=1 Tax=Insolitispirillum peregrinum TaxID=80876 RepID=A0A1N7LS47_9PROT|nr:XkdF-like putative serine protease domain-containing protein [Insolitispirillum peregrinum]SIS76592.1 Putative phage serine protease XkdF [Insolitispirillum peregrinum]